MNKRMLTLLALGLVLNSCAQKNEADKIKDIDTFLHHYQKLNKFNGAVLVAQGGKVLLSKGYGYRDFESKTLNDTNSIFQIYSITKTFTSTMIFKLIEQSKLRLDDPLSKFYPSFPNGDKITIEHLLTHTSGINDDAGGPDALHAEEYRVAAFAKNKPHFQPGDGWSYCNGGYQLLGYIIHKITGKPYELAIRENIFLPLGMSKSGFDFKGLSSAGKTTAYHIFTDEEKQIAALYDSTGPFSAGSIYSTVGDLYRYYKSFRTNKIIGKESQEIAFSASGTNKNYGHGWQLNNGFLKSKVVSHGGGAVGFRSNFAMIPDDDICIIILNNHENAQTEFLTRRIYELLHNEAPELVKEVRLGRGDLDNMVGAFSMKNPRLMIYTSIVDGRLAVQVAGQNKSTVLATNEDTFIQEEANAILKFTKDEKGIYSKLIVTQGSHTMEAERIESAWGLIGDATPNGWSGSAPDIKFSEDKERKGVWTLQNVVLRKGEMKFRLDNDWNINYGDNNADGLLDMHGGNIKVESGVYDIVLDLREEGVKKWRISRTE